MNRRAFLKAIGSAALLPMLPRHLSAATTKFSRRRPSDANWPSSDAWKQLSQSVGGKLTPVDFPLSKADSTVWKNLKNPYYIRDNAGLTQTLGWVDAWTSKPSAYGVMARNAEDIAAAVKFAHENDLRLAIRGGGHSYQGTSNAPDSLLIWTRDMHDIEMHDAFVPQGCAQTIKPLPAVTVGAGTIGLQAYTAVTTEAGKYVQGGGCLTVGLAGLAQGGGFGSYSKRYGTAAGSLLEAEVITADGKIRIANACTNSDLYWALKGGGGGTFGVVSKMTLRVHELPEFFGATSFTIKASSDDAYRRLIRQFVAFYAEHLFNEHWGEQAQLSYNQIDFQMSIQGLDSEQANKTWQPFLDWVKRQGKAYSIGFPMAIGSIPARHYWDAQWVKEHWPEMLFPRNGNPLRALADDILPHLMNPIVDFDDRPGAPPGNALWKGNRGESGWVIWGYESLWLPDSLLASDSQERLADTLFAASRHFGFALHFNKGLAGGPPESIALAKDTATNPAVLSAFALVISATGEDPAYPGIPGHEPSLDKGRDAAARIHKCMDQLRALVPNPGAYCSESNFFEKDFRQAYWGSNYPRLLEIKKKYDPDGLFIVHNGVGSEQWSADGFTKL